MIDRVVSSMVLFLLLLAVELVLLACNAEGMGSQVACARGFCYFQRHVASNLLSRRAVILNSSAARVCPGGTVVFTCTTDTGDLLWDSSGMNELYEIHESQLYMHDIIDIFTVNLTGIDGMTLVSTATVQNVQLTHNGRVITCSDATFQGSSISRTVQISGIIIATL